MLNNINNSLNNSNSQMFDKLNAMKNQNNIANMGRQTTAGAQRFGSKPVKVDKDKTFKPLNDAVFETKKT